MFLLMTPSTIQDFKGLNFWIFKQWFRQFQDEVLFVKRREKDFLIKCRLVDKDLYNLKDTTFEIIGFTVTVTVPWDLNVVKGVISHTEIAYLKDRELLHLLEPQGVKYVSIKPGGAVAVLGWAKSSDASSPPPTVVLGWDTVVVRPFVPRPTRCNKCQRYGHIETVCHVPDPVCSRCGQSGHSAADCKTNRLCCPACSGPHSAQDSACPRWKEEKAVAQLKIKERLSYKDALLRVRQNAEDTSPPPSAAPPPPAPAKKTTPPTADAEEETEDYSDESMDDESYTDSEEDAQPPPTKKTAPPPAKTTSQPTKKTPQKTPQTTQKTSQPTAKTAQPQTVHPPQKTTQTPPPPSSASPSNKGKSKK